MGNPLRLILFVLVFSFFILSGCKKEETPDPVQCLNCEFSCIAHDKLWEGNIKSCGMSVLSLTNSVSNLYLSVYELNPADGVADYLSFGRIPPLPGRYAVRPLVPHVLIPSELSVTMSVLDHQEHSNELYTVSDSLESYIDVEYVNLETNEWKIAFHLEMELYRHSGIHSGEMEYPEKFTISQGIAKGEFPE